MKRNCLKSQVESRAVLFNHKANYDKLVEALKNVMGELKCYTWSKETQPVYDKAQQLLQSIEQDI